MRQSKGYIHGFTREEQDRLYQQARLLERRVFENIDFSHAHRIVEVGCGVGAQTEILLEHFPHLNVEAVDPSDAQLARAKERLAVPLMGGRVKLTKADGMALPFAENAFDGAFVCWVLEHVPKPLEFLGEVRRVMKPGATIYCTEVLNSTLFLHPYSPATLQYWFSFNDHQWNLGGDPFVGAKLGTYLLSAGFQQIGTEVKNFHYDVRTPKLRAQIIDDWAGVLLSGTKSLLDAKHTTPEIVAEMKKELEALRKAPDAVFFWSAVQAKGQAF